MKTIVTSYVSPDLDGVSSMVAYSEYLNKTGVPSTYHIEGVPKKEVGIVCDLFHIVLAGEKMRPETSVVVVDTNNLEEVPFVTPEQIVEFIDHHSKNKSSEACTNAKIQIERLGAAATLVAERFKENNISISRESAILLYYGIISNSINLKASITSQKDIEMTEWLKKQCSEISEEMIKTIFTLKSKIEDKDLREEMEAEIVLPCGDKRITVAQLELAGMEDFLQEKEEKIVSILQQLKREKDLDYICINCVDILNGFNMIVTIDDETEQFLEKLLGCQFENRRYKFDKIMQRKDITKAIREFENKEEK